MLSLTSFNLKPAISGMVSLAAVIRVPDFDMFCVGTEVVVDVVVDDDVEVTFVLSGALAGVTVSF